LPQRYNSLVLPSLPKDRLNLKDSMDPEAFKFGPLLVTAKRLGSSRLYHVEIRGEGDVFSTDLEAESPGDAALHLVLQLEYGSRHPHQFFNRRKLAAINSGAKGHELEHMIDVVNAAVAYAHRNREHLTNAVRAIASERARRLGDYDA
jgi:hypothetical protein